ncbi:MAG: DUF3108 domain-containing protein [Bacteroidales bacterium]|nr:DUF3108 domain-containing protein [Bacteroidales bacterium]
MIQFRLKNTLFIFLIFLSHHLYSQCFTLNTAFKPGEKLNYLVYYNWGFVWVDAGWVEFSVDTANYKNHDSYYFYAIGQSHKGYDWFFKVREEYKAYLDMDTYAPLWFERKSQEGSYTAYEKYVYDRNRNKVYSATENSDRPFKNDTLVFPKCGFDALTLIYYARNINFSHLKVNDKIPVTVVIDNEFFEYLYVTWEKRPLKPKKE